MKLSNVFEIAAHLDDHEKMELVSELLSALMKGKKYETQVKLIYQILFDAHGQGDPITHYLFVEKHRAAGKKMFRPKDPSLSDARARSRRRSEILEAHSELMTPWLKSKNYLNDRDINPS